jgi:predicted RNA-binding protein with PUA-like domain
MGKKYWLIKSEPSTWSWKNQLKKKIDMWDGVRNYQARNNLMKMKIGDLCFFYHSVTEKSIVGIVEVVKEHYPDPTDESCKFVVVDVRAKKTLKYPVKLDKIKNSNKLKDIPLIKQSRLSVMPITSEEYQEIVKLSNSK